MHCSFTVLPCGGVSAGLASAARSWTSRGDQAARRQLPWLRLDCNKANEQLQAYYQRQAFTYLRTVDLPHRVSGALFQRHAELNGSIHIDELRPDQFVISL